MIAPASGKATTVTCTADGGASVTSGALTFPANSAAAQVVAVTGAKATPFTLRCRSDTGLLASVVNGVSNEGKDCYGSCNAKQGKCAYCGTLGICCRFGSADKSGGCDGVFGISGRGHTCVPDTRSA